MATRGERIVAGLAAGVLLAVLVVASVLQPAEAGHGTHEQLGLPRCGWLAVTGKPCPTCGMTTAFAHAAHAQPLEALAVQPMGAMLALGTAVGFWGCLHVCVLGSRLGWVCGTLLRPRVLWVAAGLWSVSWVYKLATWTGP